MSDHGIQARGEAGLRGKLSGRRIIRKDGRIEEVMIDGVEIKGKPLLAWWMKTRRTFLEWLWRDD